ncbi:MAG: DNA recombination protein RmuC [Acidimicrobiia bacterium]
MELLVGALAVVAAVLAVVVVVMLRGRKPSGSQATPGETDLVAKVEHLLVAHQQLVGRLDAVSEQQAHATKAITDTVADSQMALTKQVNERLAQVDKSVGSTLSESAEKTAQSLGDLTARLEAIDKAQQNITGLADQVVTLQHILDDNQARGAFGEVQLNDIVTDMLPNFAYALQKTLGNGKVVDCLIRLPDPPGPIAVDAKFPLTAFQKMMNAEDAEGRLAAQRQLTADTKKHVRAIAEKYVSQPFDETKRTAQNALMFVPSEAVFAELHAHHPTVIIECQRSKVYLVSPSTLMATLTTIRAILRDVEMRKQAGVIQEEVGTMLADIGRLSTRVGNLDRHFAQAADDITDIKISAGKIENRGKKIESLELDDPDALDSGDQDALPLM